MQTHTETYCSVFYVSKYSFVDFIALKYQCQPPKSSNIRRQSETTSHHAARLPLQCQWESIVTGVGLHRDLTSLC